MSDFPKIDEVLAADPDFESILNSRQYSAERVSDFLFCQGHHVSASTIRTYRRSLEQKGSRDTGFTD